MSGRRSFRLFNRGSDCHVLRALRLFDMMTDGQRRVAAEMVEKFVRYCHESDAEHTDIADDDEFAFDDDDDTTEDNETPQLRIARHA